MLVERHGFFCYHQQEEQSWNLLEESTSNPKSSLELEWHLANVSSSISLVSFLILQLASFKDFSLIWKFPLS